jgi:hypothetical protein
MSKEQKQKTYQVESTKLDQIKDGLKASGCLLVGHNPLRFKTFKDDLEFEVSLSQGSGVLKVKIISKSLFASSRRIWKRIDALIQKSIEHGSSLNVKGIDLRIDNSVHELCKVSNETSSHTRGILYFVMLITLLSFIAVVNTHKWNWIKSRIDLSKSELKPSVRTDEYDTSRVQYESSGKWLRILTGCKYRILI